MPSTINPKKAVESAALALNTSQYRTNSSALHSIYFVGDIQPWPGFLSAVQICHENRTWRQQTLGYMIQARDLYAYGNVEVGDEHGVQGRFQKFFGDVLPSSSHNRPPRKTSTSVSQILNVSSLHTPAHLT
ncbi:hypothetical protein N7462_002265 [Penicillium macrosclerotiorum]|uniref:uncharacterized protein n=1 Tax=Penicillium macrosclerotiorum TaxID=303699 RepID=UPI002548D2E8|nr:uncharacterized protein N7462_002265 [Penicillium macrosclerotiorum]KAJ5692842.1 hypothetical protein N7462_002265 [Penicillium macrosclerotiorum]